MVYRRHLRFRRQDWDNIVFTHESHFHLDSSDGWSPSLSPHRRTLLNTCLSSMTNMTRPLTILFLCVNHITDCLIKELGIYNSLHIPRRHLRKRKSWIIIGLFYVPLVFKQHYIAGSAKCSMKPLSKFHIGFRVTVTLATWGVVWIRCEFWRTLKIC